MDIYDADYSQFGREHSPKVLSSLSVEELASQILDSGHLIYKETLDKISAFNPDIIGLTVWSAAFDIVQILTERIKDKISADILVIAGGHHASAAPDELAEIKSIDLVVREEGELIFKEIIEKYSENSEITGVKGISYYDEDLKKVVHNPDMPLIQDLDSLPFPERNSSFLEKAPPSYYCRVITSRGCPFSCIFCNSHRVWGKKVRFRSPQNVLEEMKELKEIYNVKSFAFSDDNFTLSKERTLEICKLIRQQLPGIEWIAGTRVDLINKSLLEQMKRAGCVQIKFGIEAGNQKVMDRIRKGITIEEVKKAVKMTKDIGLKQTTFFMVGHPGETKDDIQDTINLAKELDPYTAWFNIVSPYPGTELHEIAKKHNLLDFKYWFELQHEGTATMRTGEMTRDEVTQEFRKAMNIFEKKNLKNQRKELLKRLLSGKIRISSWQDLKWKSVQLMDLLKRSFMGR